MLCLLTWPERSQTGAPLSGARSCEASPRLADIAASKSVPASGPKSIGAEPTQSLAPSSFGPSPALWASSRSFRGS